jgi:hypothetical protein
MEIIKKVDILELSEKSEGLLREATCTDETGVTEVGHVALHTRFNTFGNAETLHCNTITFHIQILIQH